MVDSLPWNWTIGVDELCELIFETHKKRDVFKCVIINQIPIDKSFLIL